MKPDRPTEKILTEGEHLKGMTETEGWRIAKEKLLKRTANLLNLADINALDPATIVQVIGIRQETAKGLLLWLKEIEGDVEQHKSNSKIFDDVKDEYIINLKDVE